MQGAVAMAGPKLTTELRAAFANAYTLERELGRGGTATVYLAADLKHHRQVAIKVLRRELGPLLGSDRFLQEVAIAAKLSHPHIVPLYDSGEAGAGSRTERGRHTSRRI